MHCHTRSSRRVGRGGARQIGHLATGEADTEDQKHGADDPEHPQADHSGDNLFFYTVQICLGLDECKFVMLVVSHAHHAHAVAA